MEYVGLQVLSLELLLLMQVSSNDGEDKEALHTFSFSHTFHGLTAKPKGKGTNSALSKKLHHKASFFDFPAFCAAFCTRSVSSLEQVHSLNSGTHPPIIILVQNQYHRQTLRPDIAVPCYDAFLPHTLGGAHA